MTPRRITPLFGLLAIITLSACETVKGAGRDLQGAGQVISSEVAQTQRKM
jgi:entericidin B